MKTHPGVSCLRCNKLTWDLEPLWRTSMLLTDLEAVFRCFELDAWLERTVLKTPPEDVAHGTTLWTCDLLAELLSAGFGVQLIGRRPTTTNLGLI